MRSGRNRKTNVFLKTPHSQRGSILNHRIPGCGQWRVAAILLTVLTIVLATHSSAQADPYPPDWNGGQGTAVHYQPVPWPNEPSDPKACGASCGDWQPYTAFARSIDDPRTQDPSNGGTRPQNYVNIASSCTDQTQPSLYYAIDTANGVLMFRWRVEQIANTYATGPKAGSYANTDPWNSALWTVFVDFDGNGFRDLAAHLNGSTGSPATAIDRLIGIWGNIPNNQSLDYPNDPDIHLLAHNPTAFVDQATDQILNFHNELHPDTDWPNGAAETIWDYGTSRSKVVTRSNVDGATCNEFFIDYQIPLAMLDASSLGGPSLDGDAPFSLLFCTANSLNNPFQKDCAYQGDWITDPNKPAPFGDFVTLDGGAIQSPIVDDIDINGCGPATLTTHTKDALMVANGEVQTSVQSVDFYSYFDANGNGLADDGNNWVLAASAANADLNRWATSWDTTALAKGQYLIGIQAADDASLNTDSQSNRTFSYLTAADVAALTSAANEHWYANPAPIPGLVTGTFVNSCGAPPASISKSVTPSEVTAGGTVTFTITVNNPNSNPLALDAITDTLPGGFSYMATVGGSLSPSTTPTGGDAGDIVWTFAPASVPASGTGTLMFTAQAASVVGTYTNVAAAATEVGEVTSSPVEVGVGAPRLTLIKAADTNRAAPGDSITYTIGYANDSPVNVTNVVISDTLPAGLTFVSAADGGSYNSGNRTITWNVGDIASGDGPFSVSFVATVDDPYPNTAANPLVNTAAIDSTQTSPTSASVSTDVNAPRPDLSIQKAVSASQIAPGQQATFTIDYANTGNAPATGVVISDTLPAGFTYVSATPAPATAPTVGTNGAVVWNVGSLPAGTTGSVQLTAEAAAGYSGDNPARNTATIDSDQTDPVSAMGTLGVTQSAQVCETYYFHDTTRDVGSAGTQKIADTNGVSGSGVGLAVTAPPSSYTEALRFYQDPASSNSVDFSGTISTTMWIDRKPGNGITLRGTVYDYNTTNGNTSLLGTGTQSFGGSQTGEFTFGLAASGTLPKGHRLLWVFEVQSDHSSKSVDLLFQYDGDVANSASGSGTTFADSHSSFCVSPPANLVLAKQVSSLWAQSDDTITYTIAFGNIGQADASSARLTDTLPTGTSFVSAAVNGLPITPANTSGQSIAFDVRSSDTLTDGQITAAASGELVVVAAVDQPLATGIQSLANIATLVSDQTSPITATATSQVLRPDVTIDKEVDKTLLIPGNVVTYTLTVHNNGSGPATAVTVNDVLPANAYFHYVANSTRLNGSLVAPDPVSGTTLNTNIGSLAAGATATVRFQMQVDSNGVPDGVTALDNSATVSDAGTSGSRSSDTVTVSISANPNLRLTKQVQPSSALSPGQLVTYTLTLSNVGSSAALDVLVTDPVPTNLGYAAGTLVYAGSPQTDAEDGDAGHFDVVNNQVVYAIGTLPAGATRMMQFAARVEEPLPNGVSSIDNRAAASASNSAIKEASAAAQATAGPALSIDKRGPSAVAYPAATLAADASSAVLQVDDSSQLAVGESIRVSGQTVAITAINGNSVTVDSAVNASAGDAVVGEIVYSLHYANDGNAIATQVVLSDVLPAGATFIAASNGGIHSNGVVTWSLGSLSLAETGLRQVHIFPAGLGSSVNNATIDSAETSPTSDSVTTQVGTLRLHKRTTTPLVTQTLNGAVATYVIDVVNALPTVASGVIVTDTLSPGFTYLSTDNIGGGTRSPNTPDPVTGSSQPTWGTFSIPGNGTLTIRFTVQIAPSVGPATYQNETRATAANTPVIPFDSLATSGEDVTVQVPVVTLAKGVTPNSTMAHKTVTYTLTARNIGTATAQGIVLTDTLPSDFTYMDTASVQEAGAVTRTTTLAPASGSTTPAWGRWNIGAGGRLTVTFTANTGSATGIFSNTVAAAGANTLVPTLADTAPVTVTANNQIIAGVSVSPNRHASALPGQSLTYTHTVINTGNATDIFSLTVASDQGFPLELGTDSLTLAPNASATVVVTLTVPTTATSGLVDSTTLTATSTNDPSQIDTATDTTTVEQSKGEAPDLAITKTDGRTTVRPGLLLTYTLTISNRSDQAASGVRVTDTLPANTAFVSASNGGSAVQGNATWPPFGLNAHATLTRTLTVRVGDPLPSGVEAITNTVKVADNGANGPDPITANNSDTDVDHVLPTQPNTALVLRTTKQVALAVDADHNGFSSPGDTLTYTVFITNSGGTTATGAVFTDRPGRNTTLVAGSVQTTQGTVTRGNGSGDATVDIQIGAIAGGDSVLVSFQVTINSPLPAGVTQLNNQGFVQGGNFPTVPSDDPSTPAGEDPTAVHVVAAPVLAASKRDQLSDDADSNGVPSPGDTLLYQVTVRNTGNQAATHALFLDRPDRNTTLVAGSVQTTQGTVIRGNSSGDTAVEVQADTIPGGGSVTISFRVTINSPLPAGVAQISNQGLVSSDAAPSVTTDDPDTDTVNDPTLTPVEATPLLVATKRDTLFVDVAQNGVPDPGDTLLYRVVLKNNGNTAATGVTLEDSLDANTTLVVGSVQTSQGIVIQGNDTGQVAVSVAIGRIPAGGQAVVSYEVTIDDPLPAGVTELRNQARYDGDNIVAGNTDNPDTAVAEDPTGTALTNAILTAYKTDALLVDANNNGAADPGDTLLYQVTIANVGAATASNVVFQDTPDPQTTLVVGSVHTSLGDVVQGNSAGNSIVDVAIGTLPGGSSVTLSFQVTVNDPLAEDVIRVANQGVVSSTELLDVLTDDPATAEAGDPTITPVGQVDLLLSKSALPGPGATILPGDRITYTLMLRNLGNTILTNVTLRDTIPEATTYITDSAVPSTSNGPYPLVWAVPTLTPGATYTATFVVSAEKPNGATAITNTATVESDQTPLAASNSLLHPFNPTAIDLLSFRAIQQAGGLRIEWQTGAEIDTWGFHLWRSSDGQRENAARITARLLPAQGRGGGASYNFIDTDVVPNVRYTYWLQERETSGRINEYGPIHVRFQGAGQPQTPSGPGRLFLPLISKPSNRRTADPAAPDREKNRVYMPRVTR